jgi:excinuclease UvrABC nuclease subunit
LESQIRDMQAKKAVGWKKKYDPEILQKRIDLDERSLRHFNGVDTDALDLIKGKTGIYLFINKVNKKKYVGKAKNLQDRLRDYTNKNSLTKAISSSMFARALLKFGENNFSFSIIEHCSTENLNKREQFYIKLLKPQYNIRKPSCDDIKYPT